MNVTRAALLERAESFRAELTARAPEFERARRLPPDMAAKFAEAGFMAMLVPQAYGGLETDPLTFLDVVETLAEADGSAAPVRWRPRCRSCSAARWRQR